LIEYLSGELYSLGYKVSVRSQKVKVPKTRKRTPVQVALIELRGRLGHSQESLARQLKVSLPTVGKWETTTPPTAVALAVLYKLAADNGHEKLARVFDTALEQLKATRPRIVQDIRQEQMRWTQIDMLLGEIQTEAERLKDQGSPDGKRIYDLANDMWQVLAEIHLWSWRNK
jgi:transcriptional regulator with XRE-family HTH domain